MPKQNTANPPTIWANLILAADGSAVTSGASVSVSLDGGNVGAGNGTLTYTANGDWKYVPTQAECNCQSLRVLFYKSGAVPVGVTVLFDAKIVSDLNDIAASAILQDSRYPLVTNSSGKAAVTLAASDVTGNVAADVKAINASTMAATLLALAQANSGTLLSVSSATTGSITATVVNGYPALSTSQTANFYTSFLLVPITVTNAANAGIVRYVTYNQMSGTTITLQVSGVFPAAPSAGDQYLLLGDLRQGNTVQIQGSSAAAQALAYHYGNTLTYGTVNASPTPTTTDFGITVGWSQRALPSAANALVGHRVVILSGGSGATANGIQSRAITASTAEGMLTTEAFSSAPSSGDYVLILPPSVSTVELAAPVTLPSVIPPGWIGTGTGQINVSAGVVAASGNWNTTAPDNGTISTLASRLTDTRAGYLDNLATAPLTTLGSNAPVGWINAAAIAAAALNGKGDWNTTTPPTANAIAAAILGLADGIESGITLKQALQIIGAAVAGLNSGATFKGLDKSTTRIAGTVDDTGNRTAVEYNV